MRRRLLGSLAERRITFALVLLVVAVAVGAAELLTVRDARAQLVDRVDRDLARAVASANAAVDLFTPSELARLSRLDAVIGRQYAVILIDRSGRRVVQLPTRGGSTASLPELPAVAEMRARARQPFTASSATGGIRYRVVSGPFGSGATIAMATPLAFVDDAVARLVRRALLIGGLAIVALAALLWAVLRAAARPTEAMIGVASRIGRGDLAARVEPDGLRGDAAELAKALNQMVEQLEAAFAERSASAARLRRFVADASHELRTPLTHIRGYAELARSTGSTDTSVVAQSLERIESETLRMATLVDDMLLLARLDQGRELLREPVDVVAVVRDLVVAACAVEPDRRITLESCDAALVAGDEERLRQLFSNLLANVRVHTEPRAPCDVTVTTHAGKVVVAVDDSGPGMAPDVTHRAFDRFYRAETSRSRDRGGTGLGLAIAHAVTAAHEGTIQLGRSTAGGVHVEVTLPLAATDGVTTQIERAPDSLWSG